MTFITEGRGRRTQYWLRAIQGRGSTTILQTKRLKSVQNKEKRPRSLLSANEDHQGISGHPQMKRQRFSTDKGEHKTSETEAFKREKRKGCRAVGYRGNTNENGARLGRRKYDGRNLLKKVGEHTRWTPGGGVPYKRTRKNSPDRVGGGYKHVLFCGPKGIWASCGELQKGWVGRERDQGLHSKQKKRQGDLWDYGGRYHEP